VSNPNSERILAQAKLIRLDEKIPRPSEPSSPRRDFAQWQRWLSDTFAQARAARLGEIIRVFNLLFTCRATKFIPKFQFHTASSSKHQSNTKSCNPST